MDVTAYTFFNKRKNSTKRPSGGHKRNVVLLDDVSLYNPVFQSEYWDYNDNYCYWANRYYYVTDVVTLRQNLFEVHCDIDPLATWKEDIMNTSAFVTFSTSSFDIGIPDYRLSSDPITITKSSAVPVFPTLKSGYVISYVGKESCPALGITYAQLTTLQHKIMGNDFFNNLADWNNAVAKSYATGEDVKISTYASNIMPTLINNAGDSITRCIYMPKFAQGSVQTSEIQGPSIALPIVLAGGFDTQITGKVPSHNYSETYKVSIPWAFPNGDFRNRAQFTAMCIYLPGYGFIALNADNYQGQSTIPVQATLDSYTGELTYLIDGKAKATCNTAYPIQVGTSQTGNAIGALSGVAQAVTGAISKSAGTFVAGAYNTVNSVIGVDPSSVGSMGGSSAFECYKNIAIIVMAHNTNVDPASVASTIGRPLNAVRKIGSLSGYVQTADVEVPTSAPDEYKTVINDSLNGGMYIE